MTSTTDANPKPSPAPRRWFRVSLRGLMVLVLIVGGVLGWKLYWVRSERNAVEAIRAAGGTVLYDDQFSLDPVVMEQIRWRFPSPPGPAWLRRWLGDDIFRSAVSVSLPQPASADLLAAAVSLGGLVHLEVPDTRGLGDAWVRLGKATRLESVHLVGPGVTDQAVRVLAGLPSIRSVVFLNCAVTDEGVGLLVRLRGIRALEFTVCPDLTDAGVAKLMRLGLPNLDTFRWSRGPASVFNTLEALSRQHPELRDLSLLGTPVEDGDLSPVGGLRSLRSLNLTQTRITDAGLGLIGDLPELEALTIPLAGMTDAGLKSVAKFATLQTLNLRGSKVTDAGLTELVSLFQLKQLDLSNTGVTDAGMTSLGALTGLTSLSLNGVDLTDAGLKALGPLRRLQFLSIGATKVTPSGITFLKTTLPLCSVNTVIYSSFGGSARTVKTATPVQP